MRLICAAVASAFAGCAAAISTLVVTSGFLDNSPPSSADLTGIGVLSFASTLLVAACIYAPTLRYGQRQWKWPPRVSMLIVSVVSNIPVWTILLAGHRSGMFGGWSEPLAFALGYVTAGVTFAAVAGERPTSSFQAQRH